MTALLEEAFHLAQQLPDGEQNAIALRLLSQLREEERWERFFAQNRSVLQEMANEARAEYERGETIPLDDSH